MVGYTEANFEEACAFLSASDDVPNGYADDGGRSDESKWREGLREELDSHDQNKTWEIVKRPLDA